MNSATLAILPPSDNSMNVCSHEPWENVAVLFY